MVAVSRGPSAACYKASKQTSLPGSVWTTPSHCLKGTRTVSFWPHALHSKEFGLFRFRRLFLLPPVLFWPFLSLSFHVDQVFERADDGYRWDVQPVHPSFLGRLYLRWETESRVHQALGPHSPFALSLQFSTYCFSFQICDCTNSFHMKEFSLFK